MTVLTLQCFVRGREDNWEAFCADLDIAVTGRSLVEVRTALNEAIDGYIKFALEQEPHVKNKLLARKAPWHVRASWKLRVVWHTLRSKPENEEIESRFDVTCPA